ncbi:MAG TPA: AgmX/PglI C-terminal domain-containing protein, partial [Kofleriaceae bacterium]|nr:AgmX/PglI C-terminal domain-containing protein [Kofleriaceae bacterium]
MRLAALVVATAVSACGPAPAPAAPDAPPRLALVGCAPAAPLPRTAADLGLPGAPDRAGPLGARRRTLGGAPSVIPGAPVVNGPLDEAVIERMVRGYLPELRACYERELAADPGMTGSATVAFTAGPDGKVTTTSVLGSGVSPAVSACVVRVVQTLSFPTGQMISVRYPFQFVTGAVAESPRAATAVGPHRDAPWTPFALGDEPPPVVAPRVARATEGAVRRALPALAACFAGPAPVGSLRAMLTVREGAIEAARAGGLGDAAEACVAHRLAGLGVAARASEPV